MSYDAETYVLSGSVSQSAQFAPYDSGYETRNTTPYTVVYTDATELNSYLVRRFSSAFFSTSLVLFPMLTFLLLRRVVSTKKPSRPSLLPIRRPTS